MTSSLYKATIFNPSSIATAYSRSVYERAVCSLSPLA